MMRILLNKWSYQVLFCVSVFAAPLFRKAGWREYKRVVEMKSKKCELKVLQRDAVNHNVLQTTGRTLSLHMCLDGSDLQIVRKKRGLKSLLFVTWNLQSSSQRKVMWFSSQTDQHKGRCVQPCWGNCGLNKELIVGNLKTEILDQIIPPYPMFVFPSLPSPKTQVRQKNIPNSHKF